MRIAIHQQGKEDKIYSLTASLVLLGEEAAASEAPSNATFIPLPPGAASGLQFEIRRGDEGYFIRNFGGVYAEFKNEEFGGRNAVDISLNDVLKLRGEAAVFFIDEGPDDVPPERALKPTGREWQALQEAIHESLRKEFEQDKGRTLADLNNEEDKKTIKQRLRTLINENMGSNRNTVALDQFVGQAALRRALRQVDAGGSEAGKRADGEMSLQDRLVESRLARLVNEVLGKLGLNEQPEAKGWVRLPRQAFDAAVAAQILLLESLEKQDITRITLYENIHDLIFHLGPISDLLDIAAVTEIMVVRYDQIFFERRGEISQYPYNFTGDRELVTVIRRMLHNEGRSFNRTSAMVDFRYEGHRVNAIGDPLALKGAALTIRKFPTKEQERPGLFELANDEDKKSMSLNVAAFLRRAALARKNIVISGGTGSGKTTLLNALGRMIPERERVVTIEDTAEMDFGHDRHVVSLQARPATVESRNEVTIRDLVRNALRMRPDRIIIGECRGAEALDMLQAMNTGHAGSMTTAHANTTHDMMLRLETMVLQAGERLPVSAVRQQIVGAIDLIVQLNRIGKDRFVTDVAEVYGIDPRSGEVIVESIYSLVKDKDGGPPRNVFTGYLPTFTQEVLAVAPHEKHEPAVLFA